MATINYLYRSVKNSAPLNIRLLYRSDNIDYVIGAKTRFIVDSHYWKKLHPQKRPKDIDITNEQIRVKKELNKIENHLLTAFNNTPAVNINKEWLEKQLDLYYSPVAKQKDIPDNLVGYINYYIDFRKNELSASSIRKFNLIRKKMERMEAHRVKTIFIKDIDENFKKEFVEYYKKESYSNNTMQRELVFIKTFCKHARTKGIETHTELDNLKLPREKVTKVYLTFGELEQIEKVKDLPTYLENAKDWLIISCYCGQRISDFMRFTSSAIRIENKTSLLEFTQKKTGKIMTIPVHPKILEILKKRGGEFPYAISDQKYNDYIKVVCRRAKLKNKVRGSLIQETAPESKKYRKSSGIYEKCELVTSHIGRRSFASNFYGTIPTNYLIYITGHSSESQFLQYIGKSNKDLAMEITKYF